MGRLADMHELHLIDWTLRDETKSTKTGETRLVFEDETVIRPEILTEVVTAIVGKMREKTLACRASRMVMSTTGF